MGNCNAILWQIANQKYEIYVEHTDGRFSLPRSTFYLAILCYLHLKDLNFICVIPRSETERSDHLQHQDQKQQDSGAMFSKALVTTKFFLLRGLSKCST